MRTCACVLETYSWCQYKVSVTYRLQTVPYFKKKSLARLYCFILLGVRNITVTRDPNRGRSQVSSGFFFSVLPLLFFPPVSYSAVPLQSIDCFCSSRRLIASLLARFVLVHRWNCFCSYSHQFRFSPLIVYALLLTRSASVRRLFLLFSSINSFSSRQFRSSPSIVSAVLVARSASVHRLFLLF